MVVHATHSPRGRRVPDANLDGEDWVDFDSSKFQESVKTRKKKKSKDPEEEGRSFLADARSVASWMNKPIQSDASWMPVAPPRREIGEERGSLDTFRSAQDDAPREQPEPISVPQSPAQRRRVERELHQNLQSPPTPNRSRTASSDRNGMTTIDSRNGGPSTQYNRNTGQVLAPPSPQGSRGRSQDYKDLNRNGTPVRRGRARSSSRGPPESPKQRSRSNSQGPTARGRANTSPSPANRGRSGSRTPVTRERSLSRDSTQRTVDGVPVANRPPRASVPSSTSSIGPGLPRPSRPGRVGRDASDDASARTMESARTLDVNVGRKIAFDATPRSSQLTPRPAAKKEGGLMEKLFGDKVDEGARKSYMRSGSSLTTGSDSGVLQLPERIHPRILLSATVYHNAATNLWITTINTNQRGVATNPSTASKYLKAFSFSSEKEARESAIANAPPKMLPFSEHPECFICNGKFAVFRRASHCRNCGVCICSSCTTLWPARMVPETYNLKNESKVKVCISCDWLSHTFRKALLKGDLEEVVALYGTGNINLRTAFPPSQKERKGEVSFPIHCAVEGGNLNVVRWLLEERFCLIKRVSGGSGKKKRGLDIPILTSKGRSVLNIAMTNLQVDILRYLVIDRSVSIYEIKDLTTSLRALEAVLLAVPTRITPLKTREIVARWAEDGYFDDEASEMSGSFPPDVEIPNEDMSTDSRRAHDLADTCIICYDNAINCVMTPCGHQICCLECGQNMSNCPVCNVPCEFIRIFKP